MSRESTEAQYRSSERKVKHSASGSRESARSSMRSNAPSALFEPECASRINAGRLSVHVHGPSESMKAYGPSVQSMCRAILRADVVLVIASQYYFESYQCRLEANYLLNQKVDSRACSCRMHFCSSSDLA